jgi:hypothetical protein
MHLPFGPSLAQPVRVAAARLKRRIITYRCVWLGSPASGRVDAGAGAPATPSGIVSPKPVQRVREGTVALGTRNHFGGSVASAVAEEIA